MRPQTKETRSVVADVLNEQMEKFLKRLESQDYAPSGVVGYPPSARGPRLGSDSLRRLTPGRAELLSETLRFQLRACSH